VPGAASAGARDIPPGVQRRARRLAWVYLIVAVGLIVWTVFLALSLPKENLEHHYRLTWVGFDLIEVLAIYLTAHMAFRLDARVVFPATAAATLLVADAGERPRPRPPVRRDPVVVRPLGQCAALRAPLCRRAIGSWIAAGVSTGARRGLPGTRRARQRRASATCRKVVGGRAGAVGLPDSSRGSQKPRRWL
jgi:hypothetical protein